MTKQEFLIQLQRELNGSIGSREAAPHVAYYQEYIEIEMRKGRSQEEIMEELGSPRLITRSIAEASRHAGQGKTGDAFLFSYGKKIRQKCVNLLEDTIKKAKKWFDHL